MLNLISLLVLLFAPGVDAQSALFKDPTLEAAVRKYLPDHDSDGLLTEARLEPVFLVSTETGQTIRDLSGLEACKKLTFLYLPDAPIVDLSPLAKLSSLESITIRGAKLHDLTPLAGLTNLQYLDLADDDIADIHALASLKALTHLDLSNNRVTDISPLSGLQGLQELMLAGNQVSDLRPVASMKSLWLLDVEKNRVRDLSPLSGLNGWRYLYLGQNQIQDLAPLVAATKPRSSLDAASVPYRTLALSGNPLSDEARSKQVPELQKMVLNVMTN